MQYAAPERIDDAVRLLATGTGIAKILAGGTDLLVQMRSGHPRPDLIVDIKRIQGLREVRVDPDGFRIGAAVSGAELGEQPAVRAAWPGVVEALELIGSTQIQGRATLAGNLCNGSPAADSVPALAVADAGVAIVGPHGRREIPVLDVVTGPGKTSLARGELVESIHLPKPPPRTGDAYLRLIPRTEMDIAVVGAGVCLTLDADGVITRARVALGAVAPTVVRVPEATEALVGGRLDEAALQSLAEAACAAARPIDDKRGTRDYRIKVAGVLARRAATIAYQRARG